MMIGVTSSVVIRPPRGSWVFALVGVACLGGAAATFLAGGGGRPMYGLAGLGLLCWRLSQVRVVLRERDVELVNVLRRHRIAWADVEDMELVPKHGWIVRLWSAGRVRSRLVWGLSTFGRPSAHPPPWLRDGYAQLRSRSRVDAR